MNSICDQELIERILRSSDACLYKCRVKKSTHSEEYQAVLKMLVALRQEAGLTQRDLAKKLKREQSFVWRIESGERRLDVVEFYWVCQALGQNAHRIYGKLAAAFQSAGTKSGPFSLSMPKKKSPPKS